MVQQKFFEILWKGNIAPKDVITKITNGSLFRTADSEAWIEKRWQELLRSGNFKPWPNDTKPTRYRFCGAEEKGGKLIVTLDPCVSYRDFIGSNSSQFVEQFGEASNPHPLAVSAIITSSDKKIALTVREKVDYKLGGYHASLGGFMDMRKEQDPVLTLYREVEEELGIKRDELKDVRCFAVAYDPWTVHTDLFFSAETHLKSADIQKRMETADDENSDLFFISSTRQSIEELIVKTSHASCPVAIASLLHLGTHLTREKEGRESPEEWYTRMCAVLAEESEEYYVPGAWARLEARDTARFQEMIKQS